MKAEQMGRHIHVGRQIESSFCL